MLLARVKNKLFIQEFCYGDCHSLADICHYHFGEKYPVTLLTCLDLHKRHSFISVVVNGQTLYLDGEGVHNTLSSVFTKYNVTTLDDLAELPIEAIDVDDVKFRDLVHKSYRFEKINKSTEMDDIEEAFFLEQIDVLNQYLDYIRWNDIVAQSS